MSNAQQTENPLIFAPKTFQFDRDTLDESRLKENPIDLFTEWFNEAKKCPTEKLPESITFSSAELPSGKVSSRILLFKELDPRGFTIYSNWGTSGKAHDIKTNPYGAINFFWRDLERQVRIEGPAEYVNRETSDRYFKTRPRGSKVGAWSSPQSQVIKNRDELDELNERNTERFKDYKDDEIPCPEFWGGLRIVPLRIEFWQGRPSRLHDRFLYTRESENDPWKIERIAP